MEINASDMPRAMQCAGALKLSESAPQIETAPSESHQESEAARYALNALLTQPIESVAGIKCPNGFIITEEMENHVVQIAHMISHRDMGATLFPNCKIDFGIENTSIRGVAECLGWNRETGTLYIDEMKYGWRPVEVWENWQMIACAIGATIRLGYAFKQVVFTLHQPRPFHPDGPHRSVTIGRETIGQCHQKMLAMTRSGDGVCATGPECYGCKAAAICPSAQAAAMSAIDVSMRSISEQIDGAQVGYELVLLERAEEAIKVRKKARTQLAEHMIRSGQHVNGWGLQASSGNRKWIDGISADMVQAMTGIDVSDVGIITPAQAEKKGVSKQITESLTVRPSSGFKLVKQDISKILGGK